jgi:hypothetical protein
MTLTALGAIAVAVAIVVGWLYPLDMLGKFQGVGLLLEILYIIGLIVDLVWGPRIDKRLEYLAWIEGRAWSRPEFLDRLKRHPRDSRRLYGRTIDDLNRVFIRMADGDAFPPESYRARRGACTATDPGKTIKAYWLDNDPNTPGWRLTFINGKCKEFGEL